MTDTLSPPQPQQARRRTKRRRSRLGTAAFIVLLVALGLVATGVLPVRDFLERENAVNGANEQLAEVTAANALLAEDVDALYSEQEVERIAREQYGFVRPGEVGYVAVLPDQPDADVAPVESEPVERDERTIPQMIWDFITGNDLTGDG
ncbi:MAG: septum formation initiator family protein [Actinomycetia bacterium]|nr:septum formation initiator family protein [Actinomycetes bacterium]